MPTDDSPLATRVFLGAAVVIVVLPLMWLPGAMVAELIHGQFRIQQFGQVPFTLLAPVPFALALAFALARLGLRMGWHHHAWVVRGMGALAVGVVALGWLVAMGAERVRNSSQDKAVLSNLRGLAAAADQYFLENGVTTVSYAGLVGPDKYLKALNPIAGENYPRHFTQGAPLTAAGIAGARTVTYSP